MESLGELQLQNPGFWKALDSGGFWRSLDRRGPLRDSRRIDRAEFLLWAGLALPSHLVPAVRLGGGLSLTLGGAVLAAIAAFLDSKW